MSSGSISGINKSGYTPDMDFRVNLCEITSLGLPAGGAEKVKERARSVACLIDISMLDQAGYCLNDCKVKTLHQDVLDKQKNTPNLQGPPPEKKSNGLHKDVKFRDEPVCGHGTAFLIGKRLALTAAHCILDDEEEVKINLPFSRLIFDFNMIKCGECSGVNDWNRDFSGKTYDFTLLAYRYSRVPKKNPQEGRWEDWAILKLNEEVTDREPLMINFKNELPLNSPVTMLGHPSGLPMKFTWHAAVQAQYLKYFSANLDAFCGNSGSPILDDQYEVVGFLFNGNIPDYQNRYGDGTLYIGQPSKAQLENLQNGTLTYELCYKASALTFLQATLTSIDIPNIPASFLGEIKEGLNVRAECTNQGCTKFGKMNFIPIGKEGKFNIRAVCSHTICPEPKCKQPIKYKAINMIVLSACKYTIECMNSDGKYVKETLTLGAGQKYNFDISKWKFIELNINY